MRANRFEKDPKMIELGQTAANAAADVITDSTEATFMADAIDASMEVPVIVDFWAPWCGPCKTLTPMLEDAVRAAGGKVRLVKVNVDENPNIAAQLRVQSLPTVYGFVGGRPVDAFQGAQPASQIKAFVDKLVAASPAGDGGLAEALQAAEEMLAEGAVTDAAQTFAAILGEDPGNPEALGGLARAHLALGEVDQARGVLDTAPEDKRGHPAIAAVHAQIELAAASAGAGELAEAEAAVAASPDDLQIRMDLAMAQIAASRNAEAVDTLLEIFRRDRAWNEDAARTQLFKLFDALGPKDPVTLNGRRRLSSMIFA